MLTVTDLTVGFPGLVAVDGVSLTVREGRVLALLGPSGCGKSTLLRAIAGLEPLRRGTVAWDGTDLARIPVHRRAFGLMFQDGVLFPHRTVAQNVGYGLRMAGTRGPAADRRVAQLLDVVGLGGFGDRSVTELSGGEAQRVALARALAPRPRLLLLDEPLAALDRSLRDSLLADLRTILDETSTPAIFVTHDQDEAFAVADRVALMRSGRLVQTGTPGEVWAAPADEWAAGFIGYGALIDGTVELAADGTSVVRTSLGTVAVGRSPGAEAGRPGQATGSPVRVAVRPAALLVDGDGPLAARCLAAVPGPDRTTLSVELTGSGIVAPAVALGGTAVTVGQPVRLRFDPAAAAVVGSG
jgi:thiamine transport system ATP-binding protein